MTHTELVHRAKKWLINSQGCAVVVSRALIIANENPDALGWNSVGRSMLIECKTSRADFFRDAKKFFRQFPNKGMGEYRYYLTLPGMLKLSEIPDGWGLLECHQHVIRTIKKAPHQCEKNAREELKQILGFVRNKDTVDMPDGLFSCVM